MNKIYLVLYNSKTISRIDRDGFGQEYKSYTTNVIMQVFTYAQEAADFAAKKDGFIVIPAQVQSTVKEIA